MMLANLDANRRVVKEDLYVSLCTKFNAKWSQGLHLKPNMLKWLEATRENISKCKHRQDCLNRSPVAQEITPRIGKSFYTAKSTTCRAKRQYTE